MNKSKKRTKTGGECDDILSPVQLPLRYQACKLLVEVIESETSLNKQQALHVGRLLERYMYINSQLSTTQSEQWEDKYFAKTLQIETSLRLNAVHLLATYQLGTLVQMSDKQLAEGSVVETSHNSYQQLLQQKEDILHNMRQALVCENSSEDEADRNPGSKSQGALRCGRCFGTEIALEQKQTRGADESMTIFCECRRCGKRWRM